MRVVESATEWHNVNVHPLLGCWRGGNATIHGSWCEPLNMDVVNRLNQRLRQAKLAASSSPAAVEEERGEEA